MWFRVFKTRQVTVPHVDAEFLFFFCLLEESSIGPATEQSTSLVSVLIILSRLFKEPIKIAFFLTITSKVLILTTSTYSVRTIQ